VWHLSRLKTKTKTDLEASIKITAQDSNWINLHRTLWIERVKQLGNRGGSITDESTDPDDPAVGAHYLHLAGRRGRAVFHILNRFFFSELSIFALIRPVVTLKAPSLLTQPSHRSTNRNWWFQKPVFAFNARIAPLRPGDGVLRRAAAVALRRSHGHGLEGAVRGGLVARRD
jgi:hypothetical protein